MFGGAWNVKVTEDSTSLSRSKTGRFVKFIDKGISGSHTHTLRKSTAHAGLLCQLRTDICRLNSHYNYGGLFVAFSLGSRRLICIIVEIDSSFAIWA